MADGERHIYTIDEIAKELGVSKTTVSRAISGKGRISAETRARVRSYIETHDYRPNVTAKGLAQNKSYNLGLVLPSDYTIGDLPFFQRCMSGVCEMAASEDYDVVLSVVSGQDVSHLRRILRNRKVDGVISVRALEDDPVAALAREEGVPFAVVGSCGVPDILQVDNDQRAACRELTGILLMRGVRRIGLVMGSMKHLVNQNRLRGFLDAHQAMQIPVGQDCVCLNQAGDLQVGKTVEELLARGCDCIAAADDGLCRLVLLKLRELGAEVPSRVRVASFYDSALLAQNRPPVTALQFDAQELGRAACRLLLDEIAGKQPESRLNLSYQVVLRDSTKAE